ncbi:MAG: hypothetical protein QM820_64520 [Minicystis sp.]
MIVLHQLLLQALDGHRVDAVRRQRHVPGDGGRLLALVRLRDVLRDRLALRAAVNLGEVSLHRLGLQALVGLGDRERDLLVLGALVGLDDRALDALVLVSADRDVEIQARVVQGPPVGVEDEVVIVVGRAHPEEGVRVGRRDGDPLLARQIFELDAVAPPGLDHVLRVVARGDGARCHRVGDDPGDGRAIRITAEEGAHHLGPDPEREVKTLDAAAVRLQHAHQRGGLAAGERALVEMELDGVAPVRVELGIFARSRAVDQRVLRAIDTGPGRPLRGPILHVLRDGGDLDPVNVVPRQDVFELRAPHELVAPVLDLGRQVPGVERRARVVVHLERVAGA